MTSPVLKAESLCALMRRNLPPVDRCDEVIEGIGVDFVRVRLPVRADCVGAPATYAIRPLAEP